MSVRRGMPSCLPFNTSQTKTNPDMPTIASLHLYPIKSCAGLSIDHATLTPFGLLHGGVRDREWMVVDDAGVLVSQRDHPRMALIKLALSADSLTVTAPGVDPLTLPLNWDASAARRSVTVWEDTVLAYDCGPMAAEWFTQVLNLRCHLVRSDMSVARPCNPVWVGEHTAGKLFADSYPLLAIGNESLADLNRRLQAQGRDALPMNRFRPNLVLDELDAYEEDFLASLATDHYTLKPVKPCIRCPIPSIDQDTGVVGPDPLDVMHYRANDRVDGAITFGMLTIAISGIGTEVRVGDHLAASLNF